MMKFLKLSLALGLMMALPVTLNAGVFKPFLKTAQQSKADIPPVTVVDEDFSLFTAGSEAEPDATDLALETFRVPDSYMHEKGWVGGGIHQAGGTCALRIHKSYDEDREGFISTPLMDLYGDVVLTFRAKRMGTGKVLMDVVICDQWEGPREDHARYDLTDEWQTFTYKTDAASFGKCNIQISAVGTKEVLGEALIDDIKVTRVKNKIETPDIQYPINNSLTEFTAWWTSVKDAKDYLLNVYYTEMPDDALPQDSVLENFDGIKLNEAGTAIDETAPNYPEGWTIRLKPEGQQVATTAGDYHSAPLALVLDTEGDSILTPEIPAEINRISFWVKPSNMEEEEDMISLFSVVVYYAHIKEWRRIANIPNYYIEEEGEFYVFEAEAIGDYARQVKFEYIQDGDAQVAFMIDDIQLSYATQPQPVTSLEKAVADTAYTVSGIDPEKDYYCYVRARDGEVVSGESYRIWVNGLNGLKPVVEEATDITETGFTANWERMPKAATYKVELGKRITAKADMTDVVILQEDFNLVKEGTIDAPQTIWSMTQPDLAEFGYTKTSWTCTQGMAAEGMVGSMGPSWMGGAGLVVSPKLSLHNNGGQFKVTTTVYNMYPSDTIWVMLLKTLEDSEALVGIPVPCGATPGRVNATIEFPTGGQADVLLAFMSQKNLAFYVDDVTVYQDLKAGDKVEMPYLVAKAEGDNSYAFKDLSSDADYTYAVTAKRTREYMDYMSERSDEMVVLMNGTDVEDVLEAAGLVVVSLPDAIAVYAETAGLPIALYDMQGRLRRVAVTSVGATTIGVETGLYIVRVGQKTAKVMVK